MARIFADKLVVSIDIGTTKICVLVGKIIAKDRIELIGIGKAPSDGLKKGVVVDMQKTITSIRAAVKEAEVMADVTINTAVIGISGGHIHSVNSQGMVAIKHSEIKALDVTNVMNAAGTVALPEGMQILHVLPQYFLIDGQDKVHNPLGMHGLRLEVQAHIIMGAIASVQNLIRACEMAGVKVTDIILEQLASAQAVLTADERHLGVAMLDIGGGTSDLAVYQHGNIRHTFVLPVAGNHFTNDLAVGLRTTIKEAERIKKEYGIAYARLLEQEGTLEIEQVHGQQHQKVLLSDLTAILYARAHELLSLVHMEMASNSLLSTVSAGLVLTGGGSLLLGMRELAQEIFEMPVRVGYAGNHNLVPESLENPMYATGYGLLKYVVNQQNNTLDHLQGPAFARIVARMKSWVIDFF